MSLQPRIVATYFTDFASYLDDVFGPGIAPGGDSAVEVAEQRVRERLAAPPSAAEVATPSGFRSALVRLISPREAERIGLAVELVALGAAVHDEIGDGRPRGRGAVGDLVMLGDIVHARALVRIATGGPHLDWLAREALEPIAINQLLQSQAGAGDSLAAYEAATRDGNAALTAAAVRCAGLSAGLTGGALEAIEAWAREIAVAVQFVFDLRHPARWDGAVLEVNRRSALALAASGGVDALCRAIVASTRPASTATLPIALPASDIVRGACQTRLDAARRDLRTLPCGVALAGLLEGVIDALEEACNGSLALD